uniref:Uncharacterized protein n=1 Tax=Myoviridae sp. ctD8022 TaxID=2825056 RepID=A0A8S5P5C6_9CAUD|nr:MAG TPA: hypothetical protein [Myoviridae sp. ctD8022]
MRRMSGNFTGISSLCFCVGILLPGIYSPR